MTNPASLFPCALPQGYDLAKTRADFPILAEMINGKPLAYLDSAASAQRPRQVLEAMTRFYERDYANIHRGVHTLSQRATKKFEDARETVRRFINAAKAEEIVFTKNATEAFNLVAQSWGRANLQPGDEVIVSELEHHANLVPWQMIAAERGAKIVKLPVTERGSLDINDLKKIITPRSKVLAIAHISNTTGAVVPVKEFIALAHEHGMIAVVDGAQAAPHMAINMRELDADFYAFTGHKLYGPSGIGVLYGKLALLNALPPYQGGGGMIASVSFSGTTYAAPPHKFEAGTPPIAEAIGLAAAIDYVGTLGLQRIAAHEARLTDDALQKLRSINAVRLFGDPPHRAGIISFTIQHIHPHDIGTILDQAGVAVRAGHHCAQPMMERFGVPATIRASFGLYNTQDDVDALIAGIRRAQELFA